MHGITGRMGLRQHLIRSILAIRNEGGITLNNGDIIIPEPILVGRNLAKLEKIAKKHYIEKYMTDIGQALQLPNTPIFFDAASTKLRAEILKKAMSAGKHVYCEKPTAENYQDALELAQFAKAKSVKNGVVQDKLFLPGLLKLQRLINENFFGKIHSIKIDFGYWVHSGEFTTAQRPSWNYRQQDGGGIILDMLPHWHYVLENLLGEVKSVFCHGEIHIKDRWDENNEHYQTTAEDAAYVIANLSDDITAHISNSWATRVDRRDLVTFQIDGSDGSAIAGLTEAHCQSKLNTPKFVWDPDKKLTHNFSHDWIAVPDLEPVENGFKKQWVDFIKHVVEDSPFPWDFHSGAKGVQFAEMAIRSWKERKVIDLPQLESN